MKKIAILFCYLFDNKNERIVYRYIINFSKKDGCIFSIHKALSPTYLNCLYSFHHNLSDSLTRIIFDLWSKEKDNGLYISRDFNVEEINIHVEDMLNKIKAGKNTFIIVGEPSKYSRNTGIVSPESFDIVFHDLTTNF